MSGTASPRRLTAFLIAVLTVALLPLAAPADAQSRDERRKRDVDRTIATQRGELAESTVALARAAEALARTALQLPAARERQERAKGELAAAEARHRGLTTELRRAEAALNSGERATDAASDRVAQRRRTIAGMVRASYIRGPNGYLGVILESQTPADLFSRATFLQAVVRDQRGALADMTEQRADLAARTALVAERRAALARSQRAASLAVARIADLTAEAVLARRSVDAQVSERAAALKVAAREKAADLARYNELQAESRRLAELIRKAARSRGTGRIGRGGLAWPANGEITSRYGYRRHPIYGSRRFHAGIDIGAGSGAGIRAATHGTVVHAGRLGSYGNIVVIDHGNGFSTAYAHQSKVAVRKGQRVRRSQLVGYVGSTGASTGPHLHFETRVNGDPVDPMRYY
ncbi:MAG TPA: peptidoglycan DD-metalloendopeptidase family protein [Mycobacteriales bacterium]|nr:peptidoglycan DD-metalloendopeptidase family protein [Mycobacteriales bacterium]